MTEAWNIGKRDLVILEKVATKEIKMVATDMHMTEDAVRAHLYRVRKRIARYRWYLNNIQNLQKKYPRIRKLTTDGRIKEAES